MDPTAAWDEIVKRARTIIEADEASSDVLEGWAAVELAEQILALDRWVTMGGFAPAQFTGGGKA